MSIEKMLSELNEKQLIAATSSHKHTLVLAGAGCGKTKTIIARAAYLISNGTPADRIHILTFTRKSASEIVERVKTQLGDIAAGLRASTFHAWCIGLMKRADHIFGCKSYSVIDRDDQLQLFKAVRDCYEIDGLPKSAELCDIYSLTRNTCSSLSVTVDSYYPKVAGYVKGIAQVMCAYEERKRARRYLDYDDILAVVAGRLGSSPEAAEWVGGKYDHILVDEMQDTNPLQWAILDPLQDRVSLYCVGDDAQSIYGFRGADFRNVHSFNERVPDGVTLVLDNNYRSTQEILNLSNWLLRASPLNYQKELVAVRGLGIMPILYTFDMPWAEARWIAENLQQRRRDGAEWRQHMLLVRSAYSGRTIESALLSKDIPYVFVGGTKLLESAHVKDVLAILRIVANFYDEIAWMRYLTLWHGVGDATAARIVDKALQVSCLDEAIEIASSNTKIPKAAIILLKSIRALSSSVADAFKCAAEELESLLAEKYRAQEWESRKNDFPLVERVASKHDSILEFIEEYVLDPVSGTQVSRRDNDDVVVITTIHSAKGCECDVCYVPNVSPEAYPSRYSIGDGDAIEEERRILYVAFTRAKNELILTRAGSVWGGADYFLNEINSSVVNLLQGGQVNRPASPYGCNHNTVPVPGIDLGLDVSDTHKGPVIDERKGGLEMAKQKLEVVKNSAAESACGIAIESCSAYYSEDEGAVIVMGEASANKSLQNYAEVQCLAYDENGDVLGREYTNWCNFGVSQSFNLELDVSDFDSQPVKVKVYPSIRD